MTVQPADFPSAACTELVIKIPIMAWKPEWDRRGFTVTGKRELPEGGLELIFQAPDDVIQEMIAVQNQHFSNQPKKTGLAAILQKLFDAANTNPGKAQRQPPLKEGMGIDVIIFNNVLRLQIWRADATGPSLTEWKTTCKYFPVPLAQRDPERFTYQVGGQPRTYLRAAWNASDPSDESPV
jgi:hypothetical protein